MICAPCADGDHERCEDNRNAEAFTLWLRTFFAGVTVGAPEQRTIHANRPRRTCPCQHREDGMTVLRLLVCLLAGLVLWTLLVALVTR